MNELLGIAIGLIAGTTMSVAVSCVWSVLLIPARIQDRLQASSPTGLTWAICTGMVFCALHDMLGFALPLPAFWGMLGMLLGGMFVGMLSAALEEILEVAPVMMRRFRLGNISTQVRFIMMLGKTLGAVLAALVFTL